MSFFKKSFLIATLFTSAQAVAVNDQGFIPVNKGVSSATIDMNKLFANGSVSGYLNNVSGRIRVKVHPSCNMKGLGAYNYFSSRTTSDDLTMILDSANGYVAENNFLKVKIWGSLGTSAYNYVQFPWNTEKGPGSNGFNCSILSSFGIYTAQNIQYEITRKRPFSQEEAFNYIKIFIFGGRQVNSAGVLPNISTAYGDEIGITTLNFVNWFTPFSCSLNLSDPVIDFGSKTAAQLVAGIEKKNFTLSTQCNTQSAYNVDSLAASVTFSSDITPSGQASFNTLNSETNEVNDKLVFVVTNNTHNKIVKNNELNTFGMDTNFSKTQFNKTINYSVQPKWTGGVTSDIPLGGYEASGIIYFNLE